MDHFAGLDVSVKETGVVSLILQRPANGRTWRRSKTVREQFARQLMKPCPASMMATEPGYSRGHVAPSTRQRQSSAAGEPLVHSEAGGAAWCRPFQFHRI
jgi:hypothetical protein